MLSLYADGHCLLNSETKRVIRPRVCECMQRFGQYSRVKTESVGDIKRGYDLKMMACKVTQTNILNHVTYGEVEF